MFLLLLTLDDPPVADRIMQAWTDLGIRGAVMLEGAGCRAPEEEGAGRGSVGFLSFAHLLPGGRVCSIMLLAPVASLDVAGRAADAVARIGGPWTERRAATLLALPVAAAWGGAAGATPGAVEDALPREPGQPRDAP